jgi:phosphoglycolate phosphatase
MVRLKSRSSTEPFDMTHLPTILFDLDGTLTNPAPGFLASIHHALRELQQPIPPDQELYRFIGPPLRESMGTLLGTEDRDLIEQAVELYRWRLNHGGKFEAEVIPGIPAVLQSLVEKGYLLYVCTGKPQCVATEIVEHFGLAKYFRKVYGAKLDGRHCDKADLIKHIWEAEKISSPQGIMIGDTVFDMLAAKANGLRAVAVRWGFGTDADLAEAGADRYVDTSLELISVIAEMANA